MPTACFAFHAYLRFFKAFALRYITRSKYLPLKMKERKDEAVHYSIIQISKPWFWVLGFQRMPMNVLLLGVSAIQFRPTPSRSQFVMIDPPTH